MITNHNRFVSAGDRNAGSASYDGRTDVEVPDAVETEEPTDTFTSTGRRGGDVLTARYVSDCVACPTAIRPGDGFVYGVDGQPEHATCPQSLELSSRGACQACWTELPVVGVCGVCE